jgi:hypothetical protein
VGRKGRSAVRAAPLADLGKISSKKRRHKIKFATIKPNVIIAKMKAILWMIISRLAVMADRFVTNA